MFSDPLKNLNNFGVLHGMTVADLGAGSGFYTFESARLAGPSGRVYAIEVQKVLVDKLKKSLSDNNLHNVEVVWGDIEKIGGTKIRELSVDRVIVSNIFFQVEKKDDLCLEIKRILKNGGKVMLIDWDSSSTIAPDSLIPKEKARALFEKIGFKFESEFDAGDHHYGIIMKK